jgi:SagB-type dehydrogenase family enzyme
MKSDAELQDVVRLPEPRDRSEVSVEEALRRRRSVRHLSRAPVGLSEVGQLLWAAQGITGPEGSRTAPSAGALYPLEVYLVAGRVEGLAVGVYRYDPREHLIRLMSARDCQDRLSRAALGQSWVGNASAVLVVAALYRRTTVKYRTRGHRYVHIEVGHACQNVYLQAEALGLATVVVGAFGDEAVASALGLDDERVPLALMPVGRQ